VKTLDELVSKETKTEEINIDEQVEKLAEVLEAFSEEDTLLDDLARAAVAYEALQRRNGQKSNV
jgi:hypothetical protein